MPVDRMRKVDCIVFAVRRLIPTNQCFKDLLYITLLNSRYLSQPNYLAVGLLVADLFDSDWEKAHNERINFVKIIDTDVTGLVDLIIDKRLEKLENLRVFIIEGKVQDRKSRVNLTFCILEK
ncbi:unnamed protein product [Rotaria sp. Silwood1]|nr:unnamed protein product [Rotaria sp. Silwood1]